MAPSGSVAEPKADLAERAAELWRDWVGRHSVLARRARRIWVLWAWCSLAGVAITAVLVPSSRPGMAVYFWMQYVLVQFWLLARTKTITWRGFGWAFALGAFAAPLIGVLDNLVSQAFGWQTSDAEALVWVAGPVEEALKLLPLIVLGIVARNRWRRLSIADFILLGAASGAAFQFVEDAIRRMTTRPSLFAFLGGPMGDSQHRFFALWPGWSDSPGGGRFPAHFVTTAIAAAGVGVAVHLHRRLGRRVLLLPVALLALAVVDHSLYNASVGQEDVVPGWLDSLWSAWGSGHEARPLLLCLLLAAIVIDWHILRSATADLPPLPGRPPAIALQTAAARMAQALRTRVSGTAAASVRRAASVAGLVVEATAFALVAILHELRVAITAARRSSAAWLGTLGYLRERRALGFAVEAGPPGRRHVSRVSTQIETQRRALAAILAGAAVLVVLVGVAHVGAEPGHAAFLANLFDDLGRWWNGLPWWQQTIVVVGLAAVLTFGGMGFLPAFNIVSGASTLATYGQGISTFIENPRQATTDYVRNLTPGEVVVQLAGLGLNRLLPAAAGGVVGKQVRTRVLNEAEQAAISQSRGALGRAVDAAADVNGVRGGTLGKTAASDGERTLSGWKQPRPTGFSEVSPEQVRDFSGEIGHELEKSGGLDQVRRDGFPGKYQASHAEKQLSILRPDDPIAVSEPMCNDCNGFFQKRAIYRNSPQVVTDPNGTWIFRPDGTVERIVQEEP